MARFELSNKVVEDLTKIWEYTFEVWSENQADIYYEMLISNCNEVAYNPNAGKNYDEIMQNLMGIRANRHIIFYRIIKDDYVEIIRILHERMDLKDRFLK